MLVLSKHGYSTWRRAALAAGKEYGLEGEVEESYEKFVAEGYPEEEAAWMACYEWDVLMFQEDWNDALEAPVTDEQG